MSEKQTSLAQAINFKGSGLHTNAKVSVSIQPAEANQGYIFQRTDLEGQPKIPALAENVTETSRSTVIEANGARVSTIEHLLSALYGMGIDNALIQLDGPEVPILDGSALEYTKMIKKAGIKSLEQEREYFTIEETISYTDKEKGIEIKAFPDETTAYTVMIDYNSNVLGSQYAELNDLNDYEKEVAGCKTFVFLSELEILLKNNLIKGGDLENAIVIIEKETTQERLDYLADLFNKPRISYRGQGILNEQDLSFRNEPARHKLLDLLGDFALAGMRLKGRFTAKRPGHFANKEFIKKIRTEIKKYKRKEHPPKIDLKQEPIYDIIKIREMLPHRPPFLLVDKIMKLTDTEIVGIKNVTMNEPFFVGHFPQEPVMPGVLIIEAMAQTGGILVLNSVPDPENYMTYFLKIDQARFKSKVVPGDTLIFHLQQIGEVRRGIVNMKAKAFVGDKLAAEGLLMAQIAKN
jgi:UDP-3-O-[3-hydroxymyristoyl] N-acetylglucosamine deacetylase / 3-hydroxyacyl-[acyl-carrier-protein] dehydratase